MENIEFVEVSESDDDLNENSPDFGFLEEVFLFFVVDDFLVEISVIGELHDDASLVNICTIGSCLPGRLPCNR